MPKPNPFAKAPADKCAKGKMPPGKDAKPAKGFVPFKKK